MKITATESGTVSPVNLISIYKGDAEKIGLLKKTYARNELRKDHLFYSNSLVQDSIKRGLTILEQMFHLQLLLGKDIYIPGIGLFGTRSANYTKGYLFQKDFVNLPVSKIQRKISFLRQVVDESTGKLNYDLYNKKMLGFIVKGKQLNYSNNITKAEMLTKVLRKYVKDKDLEVELLEPYEGDTDFSSIALEAKKYEDKGIRPFLENMNMDDCLYNIQILEDILYIVGFLAAQEKTQHTT